MSHEEWKRQTSVPVVLLNWHKILAVMFILLYQSSVTESDFIIIPQMSVVGAGATANFTCRHQSRNTFWLVNGTELVVGNTPPNITVQIVSDGVNTLNIVGKLEYNETIIQCGASNSNPLEVTSNITLQVQGSLNQVSNVTRILTTISWNPPFSLNLTNIDPDIVYCVEVYNVTCGGGSLVVSDCNVMESRFMDTSLQSGYIYNITVTPRSNVETASNGTSLTKEESFIFLNEPSIILQSGTSNDKVRVGIHLKLNKTVGSIEPASYFLILESADGVIESPQTQATTFTATGSFAVTLNLSQPLSAKRLWECQVFAFSCGDHPISNFFELSTHEFQNVSVTSSASGDIIVAGDFIASSEARGILIIAYSINNDSITNYSFIPRFLNGQKSVVGLSSNQYSVSVFVVEGNGLPFNRSATRPKFVSVGGEGTGETLETLVDHELYPTLTGVCINCIFLDSSTTDCVAVVHQRISQLSSSGLMSIESSHKFKRLGNNTAYGCIEGVNLSDSQIGVFGLIEQTGTSSSGPELEPGAIVGIVLGVFIGAVLTLGIVIFIIACKYILYKKAKVKPATLGNLSSSIYQKLKFNYNRSQQPPLGQPSVKDDDALYSEIDQNQQKAPNPPSESAKKGELIDYASLGAAVSPSPFSRGMPPDDPLKVEYSQVKQQESSLTQGPGNADDANRSGYDATVADSNLHVSSGFDEKVVNLFNSVQGHVVPSELIAPLDEEYILDEDDPTFLLTGPNTAAELTTLVVGEQKHNIIVNQGDTTMATQCTDENTDENTDHQTATCTQTLGDKYTGVQGRQNMKECLHPAMITRSCSACKEWQHKDLVLPGSYRLGQLRHFC